MENKKKIFIIGGICLLLIILGFGLFMGFKKEEPTNDNEVLKKEKESTHYADMAEIMHTYYEIYYKDMNIPKEKRENSIRVSLGQLERKGFPMDEFINYETGEACDTALSYAIRTVENSKYVIKVYYKCGNVSNYKVNTKVTTESKTTKVSE